MNFLQLQTLLAGWLDDLNYGYFTASQVKTWLNNGHNKLQTRLLKASENYYVKCVQTTLVVNQREYVLPDDFRKLHRLEIILSGTAPNESLAVVSPMTINQQDMIRSAVGTPYAHFMKRNRLVLHPAPDSALAMRLLYSYQVSDMVNDSDEPDAPVQYHEYIALCAAEDGFLKDNRQPEMILKKKAEFETMIDQDAVERNQDAPRGIVETGSYETGGFHW